VDLEPVLLETALRTIFGRLVSQTFGTGVERNELLVNFFGVASCDTATSDGAEVVVQQHISVPSVLNLTHNLLERARLVPTLTYMNRFLRGLRLPLAVWICYLLIMVSLVIILCHL